MRLGQANRSPAVPIEAERLAGSLGEIRAVYQPIVRLRDRRAVGYEALVRGPRGSRVETPEQLFEIARRLGLEVALDWECRRVALEGALGAGLGGGHALFMNVEPASAGSAPPAGMVELRDRALASFPLVVELTERALTARPTELLLLVDRMRQLGIRIALDDVGVDPRSLALLPFLQPEVIKLDLGLMREVPSRQLAEVVHAVNAEAERTGALVLAEGIESEQHLRRALALGATHGQGWLFGRPAPLPAEAALPAVEGPARPGPLLADSRHTPFEVVTAERDTRRGDKALLLELSRSIEQQAEHQGSAAVILSTFQEASFFSPATARRYSTLARNAALVAALGVGLSPEPEPGVRGVALDAAEALRGEWDVTVLGPHFAAAFVARDLGDAGPDFERRFDFAVTYDRELATRAALAMMQRVATSQRDRLGEETLEPKEQGL